ncbi:MAG: DUF4136 domain-containing protein [Thermoanaerobaculia bacterium]|nr:DUF4136 domain-containing protein [Thermoanaerobaculia bacterium]
MNRKTMQVTMVTMQLTIATLAGAASVKYDMDSGADFSRFRTVAFASEASQGVDAITDRRIRAAIRSELEAKGYHLTEPSEADLTLEYFAVVRQRRELVDTGGPRFGRSLQLRQHPEGTLVVLFRGAKGGDVVWQGAVTDAVAASPEKADRKTEKAVGKLLEKFPSKKRTT